MSVTGKRECLQAILERYHRASKKQKRYILVEIGAV